MKKFLFAIIFLALSCTNNTYDVDVLITGGTIHDGSGKKGFVGNIAVKNEYVSGSHTATMVPVFSSGYKAHNFKGVYDNTEIFNKLIEIVNQ